MALIILALIGWLLGWIASILMRTEDPREILHDIGAGLAGSFAIGLIISNFTILGGLRLGSILAAIAGALLAIMALYYYRRKNTPGPDPEDQE